MTDPRFGLTRPAASHTTQRVRVTLWSVGAVCLVAASGWPAAASLWVAIAGMSGAIGCLVPSRAVVQQRLDMAHAAAVQAELDRRVARWRAAARVVNGDAAAITRMLRLREALALSVDEVGASQVARLEAEADRLVHAAKEQGPTMSELQRGLATALEAMETSAQALATALHQYEHTLREAAHARYQTHGPERQADVHNALGLDPVLRALAARLSTLGLARLLEQSIGQEIVGPEWVDRFARVVPRLVP